jgi:V8-like Glu-specific endopeptidase
VRKHRKSLNVKRNKLGYRVLGGAAALLLALSACSGDDDDGGGLCPVDRQLMDRVAPGTYAIVFEALNDRGEVVPLFQATAFAIDERVLATNAHVTVGLQEAAQSIRYRRIVAVQSGTGTVVELELAVTHPAYTGDPFTSPDVGLLTTRAPLPSTLQLARDDGRTNVHVTDDVYVIGFPGDVDEVLPTIPDRTIPHPTALPGQVTALRNFDPTAPVDASSTDVVQHSAPTSPGTSGSPIVACGRVAAVNNAGTVSIVVVPDAQGNLGVERLPAANNNFGIDVKHLHDLIGRAASGAPLPTFDLGSHPVPTPPPEPEPTGPGGGETPEPMPTTTRPETPRPTGVSWSVFTGSRPGTRCDIINVGGGLLVATQPNGELLAVAEVVGGQPSNVADMPLPALVDEESFILDAQGREIGYVGSVVDPNGVERMFGFDLDDVVINSAGVTADALAGVDLSLVPCSPACPFVENADPAMCR